MDRFFASIGRRSRDLLGLPIGQLGPVLLRGYVYLAR